jgi:hypothetical protein
VRCAQRYTENAGEAEEAVWLSGSGLRSSPKQRKLPAAEREKLAVIGELQNVAQVSKPITCNSSCNNFTIKSEFRKGFQYR